MPPGFPEDLHMSGRGACIPTIEQRGLMGSAELRDSCFSGGLASRFLKAEKEQT